MKPSDVIALWFFILTGIAGAGVVLAGPMEDAIQDGKTFAAGRNTTIRDIPNNLDTNNVPNYQGTNVPETNYYSQGATLQNQAQTHAASDPNAQYITGARTSRPPYTVAPDTDTLLTHKPANEVRMTALTQTYSGCSTVQIPGAAVSVCGSQLICPDGNCTADVGQTHTPSLGGFTKAASYLAVLQGMTDTLDPARLEVFRGEYKKCKRPRPVVSWDCCQNSSSSYCNAQEKELEIDNDALRTHYVGTHNKCQARVPIVGTCIWWHNYKNYCSFPSKLARIVVVQGRAQINKPYGNVRNPDCSGFTLTELPSVDFEAMDLSEYHADAVATANAGTTPPVVDAVDDIKTKLENRHQEL